MREQRMSYNNKALFLDRDGVINIDYSHVNDKINFVFIDGIFDLCKLMQANGYLIIVITNQAGIGKAFYTEEKFLNLNKWMIKKFKENDITISKTYYCPHKPEENCSCRKPNPGMILNAVKEFHINPKLSVLIGDKKSDIKAGIAAGINKNIFFDQINHHNTIKTLINWMNEFKNEK